MDESIELRLCSRRLAIEAPFDNMPRTKKAPWYRDQFGTTFGSMLSDHLSGIKKRRIEEMILFPRGVAFVNPDQIAWAIDAAGAAAPFTSGGKDIADEIDAFVHGEDRYAAVPPLLHAQGIYALVPHEQCLEFSKWVAGVDKATLAAEAKDLHGEEWVPSILAIVANLGGIFGSVAIHGGDIGAWRSNS